jgi:UDP-N-acetylmuramoyl-tripeptide--D-alanyl-D-alanine ligase
VLPEDDVRLTAAELARRVNGDLVGSPEAVVTGAEVDSRRLRDGDVFVALPGARVDGHDFVAEALRVASAALVDRRPGMASPPTDRALIVVDDPLAAYHELARRDRLERSWQVVALTGSVGKTTTKDMLAALLSPHLVTGSSEGNRNSTLGLPAQLLRQPGDVEVFVAEAGMSRPGELDILGDLLRPTRLLYTRLAAVHTEFFDDGFVGVVRAKAELLRHLAPDGVLVVNAGDPAQHGFPARVTADVVRYGAPDADVRVERIDDRGLLGTVFDLVLGGSRQRVELPLAGVHQVENLLAAAACASTLGLDAERVAATSPALCPAPRRGRVHRLDRDVAVVDDSYNASPEAVRRMLDLLRGVPGRRVAVLGEMYELGPGSAQAHRDVGGVAATACDLLVAVGGADAAALVDGAVAAGMDAGSVVRVADAEAAAERVEALLEPGDVVLVKGSRGVGLDHTVDRLLGREAA